MSSVQFDKIFESFIGPFDFFLHFSTMLTLLSGHSMCELGLTILSVGKFNWQYKWYHSTWESYNDNIGNNWWTI